MSSVPRHLKRGPRVPGSSRAPRSRVPVSKTVPEGLQRGEEAGQARNQYWPLRNGEYDTLADLTGALLLPNYMVRS